MYRMTWWFVLSVSLFFTSNTVFAQGTGSSATATCKFDSMKQLAVRYQKVKVGTKKYLLGKEIPYGKVWAPGGKPMTMFTNTALAVGDQTVPVAAYTVFVIPEEDKWNLVISKSTDTGGKYNKQQDLMRVPMEVGELPSAEPEFSVYFAHAGEDQCNMRLDLQNVRAWTTFKRKQ